MAKDSSIYLRSKKFKKTTPKISSDRRFYLFGIYLDIDSSSQESVHMIFSKYSILSLRIHIISRRYLQFCPMNLNMGRKLKYPLKFNHLYELPTREKIDFRWNFEFRPYLRCIFVLFFHHCTPNL